MVDEDSISLEEFRAVFLETKTDGAIDENSESVKELKRALLNQLIDQQLFLSEAGRLKLEVNQAELQQAADQIQKDYAPGEFLTLLKSRQISFEEWKERLRQELLRQKVIQRAVPADIKITDQEVQTYYKQHPKEFVRPAMVRARQLVVANEETARATHVQLLKGADFAGLARTHSLSPDKDQGGDFGFFTKGELPEEFDIIFSLGVGKISPVVKTAYGYHIFKVEERYPARPMRPVEAAERIRAQFTQERRERLFTTWVTGLRGKARIIINDEILYRPLDVSEPAQEAPHG